MDKTISQGKYCICATQMLESMETKPRPTRAEVSDITNAVLDLTDATMTSGETTNGDFPIDAARTLRKIAQETEISVAYKRIFEYKKKYLSDKEALGAIALSFELIVDLIFIETNDLKMVNRLACLRPRAYICVFSDDPTVKKLTALNFGVYAFPAHFIKNPEQFMGTVGSDLVHNGRAKILKLETDARNKFVSYKVIRVGY
jgi:pyruvate kinase